MNQAGLKEARVFAQSFGAKCVIYGPAGSGKTPILNTAPRPLLLACEPGLLSMRNSTVPTWIGNTTETIDEFFRWFNTSAEVKNFDTLAVDSTSFMCDIALEKAKKTNKHGLAAYGEMANYVMPILRNLYFTREKHLYLIAKEENLDLNGTNYKRPYYPGKQLPQELPGLFDFILRIAKVQIPHMGETTAFRCIDTYDIMARNRTGNLNEYEEPHFGKLVAKAMSNG